MELDSDIFNGNEEVEVEDENSMFVMKFPISCIVAAMEVIWVFVWLIIWLFDDVVENIIILFMRTWWEKSTNGENREMSKI